MFDIWASVAELYQPCLYRPLDDRFVGPDGLVKKEVLASIDRLLIEHVSAGRACFQVPPSPPPMKAEHRFLNVSALQKSIRRGDAEGAMRYAQQGCGVDAEHIFKRLAVCAVEDVGLGNLLAVGMALAVMGDRRLRENRAPDELAAYLAYLLATSPKSRLACDLLSIADYDRSLDPLKVRLVKAGDQQLREIAETKDASYAERMVAAWLLAGTSRFRGANMLSVNRPKTEILKMMAAARMPLILYYIAERASARLSDAMFVSTFLMWEMVAQQPDMVVAERTQFDSAIIAGFPAEAYDLHTREGRVALSRFGRECLPLAKMLKAISPGQRDTATRHGVFIAEGGRQNEQLRFLQANLIEKQAHAVELAFAGLTDAGQRSEFLSIIAAHNGELNVLRLDQPD